ncbi:MAG: ABC-type spermidine/putrescine transport system, ATPase component [Halonotius sp. J07HN6]|nr:MAG: ABC-type spermidine/putrescine transport system, ATPase component [Halonotius sp. J07HN6]
MTILHIDGITKSFGGVRAVDTVSLSIEAGELFCLLGPSGCGKSTTLRTIAGFEQPDSGQIRINGNDVTTTEPHRRNCSMVFQDWALFPNKTVRENVAFGLRMHGVATAEQQQRIEETLSLVEMADHAGKQPDSLSGGQKQRVALARSLAVEPEILLLDEPLSNLDRKLREAMQLEIKSIQRETDTTMVYVTHDQDEAFTLADRIGIVNDGRIVQTGPPAEVYTDPTNRFVESFLGTTNFITCEVAATAEQTPRAKSATDGGTPAAELATPFAERIPAPELDHLDPGETVTASIRPERVSVATTQADTMDSWLFAAAGTVEQRLHRGSRIRYELAVGETTVITERRIDEQLAAEVGDSVTVGCQPKAITFFDADGRRLR